MSDDRTKLISEFSHIWDVDQDKSGNPSCKRQIIPELRRLMEKLVISPLTSPEFSHDVWARCFLLRLGLASPNLDGCADNQSAQKINTQINERQSQDYPQMKSEKTSQALLVAYLQTSAWYAAYEWCNKLGLGNHRESLEKSFAATQEAVSNPNHLLGKYDFTYKVRTYAKSRLQGNARHGLLKGDEEARLRKRSPQGGRLKAISPVKLTVILQLAKVPENHIADCCTLHKLYREVYSPPKPEKFGARSAEPTDADWQAIADLFNQAPQRQPESNPSKGQRKPIDAQQAKSMLMETCLKAINDYLAITPASPHVSSLDEFLSTSDDNDQTLLDKQASNISAPDEVLERAEVQELIKRAFQQLKPVKQSARMLTEVGFSMTDAAKQCDISQSMVSRIESDLCKIFIGILYQAGHHSAEPLDRAQLSEQLKNADLSENISLYCRSVIDDLLEHHWQTQDLVHQQLSIQIAVLSTALKQWLIDDLHVTKLDAVPDADQRITAFIDSWLQAHSPHPAI